MISKSEREASKAWFEKYVCGVIDSVKIGHIDPVKIACYLAVEHGFEPSAAFAFVDHYTRGIQLSS